MFVLFWFEEAFLILSFQSKKKFAQNTLPKIDFFFSFLLPPVGNHAHEVVVEVPEHTALSKPAMGSHHHHQNLFLVEGFKLVQDREARLPPLIKDRLLPLQVLLLELAILHRQTR